MRVLGMLSPKPAWIVDYSDAGAPSQMIAGSATTLSLTA